MPHDHFAFAEARTHRRADLGTSRLFRIGGDRVLQVEESARPPEGCAPFQGVRVEPGMKSTLRRGRMSLMTARSTVRVHDGADSLIFPVGIANVADADAAGGDRCRIQGC